MTRVEVETTYVGMRQVMNMAENVKMHFKRCSSNLIFNISELTLAYFVLCLTTFQSVNSIYLLLGYIVLFTAVKTLHCLFYHYDPIVRDRISEMNRLYSDRQLDQLASSITRDITMIYMYTALIFVIEAIYFITFTAAIAYGLLAIIG